VAADIKECAQLVACAADDDQRLAGDFDSEEIPYLLKLIQAADGDPVAGEDAVALEGFNAGIGVPLGGDGESAFQGGAGVVEVQQFWDIH
jgi:hypothetical protein